jgi:hypothetical protein
MSQNFQSLLVSSTTSIFAQLFCPILSLIFPLLLVPESSNLTLVPLATQMSAAISGSTELLDTSRREGVC